MLFSFMWYENGYNNWRNFYLTQLVFALVTIIGFFLCFVVGFVTERSGSMCSLIYHGFGFFLFFALGITGAALHSADTEIDWAIGESTLFTGEYLDDYDLSMTMYMHDCDEIEAYTYIDFLDQCLSKFESRHAGFIIVSDLVNWLVMIICLVGVFEAVIRLFAVSN